MYRGPSVLNDCYVELWSAPDLGMFTVYLVGCVTVRSMGFCFDGDNDDSQFPDPNSGTGAIPAVGYDFFQGPIVESSGDSAIFKGEWRHGFKNLPLTAAYFFTNGYASVTYPTQ